MVVVVLLVVLIVYLFFAIKNHKLRNQELSKELAETQADFDKKLKLQQKEAFLSAKEQLHSQREDFDRHVRDRRAELSKLENKLLVREDKLVE